MVDSVVGIREVREPAWQRSRYGETETLRIGFLLITISRPIGTQGGPRPKLRTEVGGHTLKREFDDFPEARAWALRTATKWLGDAAEEARKLADATPKAHPRQENEGHG